MNEPFDIQPHRFFIFSFSTPFFTALATHSNSHIHIHIFEITNLLIHISSPNFCPEYYTRFFSQSSTSLPESFVGTSNPTIEMIISPNQYLFYCSSEWHHHPPSCSEEKPGVFSSHLILPHSHI